VEERSVLDIACGTGYGLPILAKNARFVVGADLDLEAAHAAQRSIGGESGQVVVADGCQLPFLSNTFEVTTSFETLEHLEHRETFLGELSRVLVGQGICMLSTPNAKHTMPINGRPRNPYHVHEYEPEELRFDLSRHFTSVSIWGQDLDSSFVVPPFWDEQEHLSKQDGMRKHVLLWRVINKVPSAFLRDFISRLAWGTAFLPSENDYRFSENSVDRAPVLLAICQKNQGT
jgi:SAM-dependent methyltransferase